MPNVLTSVPVQSTAPVVGPTYVPPTTAGSSTTLNQSVSATPVQVVSSQSGASNVPYLDQQLAPTSPAYSGSVFTAGSPFIDDGSPLNGLALQPAPGSIQDGAVSFDPFDPNNLWQMGVIIGALALAYYLRK